MINPMEAIIRAVRKIIKRCIVSPFVIILFFIAQYSWLICEIRAQSDICLHRGKNAGAFLKWNMLLEYHSLSVRKSPIEENKKFGHIQKRVIVLYSIVVSGV